METLIYVMLSETDSFFWRGSSKDEKKKKKEEEQWTIGWKCEDIQGTRDAEGDIHLFFFFHLSMGLFQSFSVFFFFLFSLFFFC